MLAAAAGVRLYRLSELPLGAFVDEIFTLSSTLLLRERPFDPFGHTLVISEAWGKDHPNLFLYFNLLVLKIFGVSYWSTKLLTVIPGVIACGLVYLIARRMFDKRVALATALVSADNNSVTDWIAAENADVVNERNCINIPLET